MGDNIIDVSAVFHCNKGIGVTFQAVPKQTIASGSGKKFLNVETPLRLVSPGQCTMRPNPSGTGFLPCMQTNLTYSPGGTGGNPVIKVNGAAALTNKVSYRCPVYGGRITLQGTCNTRFYTEGKVAIHEIVCGTEDGEKVSHIVGIQTKIKESEHVAGLKQNETSEAVFAEQSRTNEIYAKCSYQTCGQSQDCPYFNAGMDINNNSNELRKNFEKGRSQDNRDYLEKHVRAGEEYPEYGWGYAAHHIICGNQVFRSVENKTGHLIYGHLIKLANMWGYNINNKDNCILLPSKAGEDGVWGTKENFQKGATAFDIMDIMKCQWHLGGHAYKIPKDSLKYYKPSNEDALRSDSNLYFPDYVTAVKARLDRLYAKYDRKMCWAKKRGSQYGNKFIAEMNEISAEIENQLKCFREDPKESYPFFVSRMAVDYAYDAPVTGKIIMIYKNQNNIYASKFRVSRKIKDHYQVVITQNQEMPEFLIQEDKDILHEFIRYCENVMHFWIDTEAMQKLPWKVNGEYINYRPLMGDRIDQYASDHATEIFTFIEKNEITNQGQIAQIRRRWKEVRKSGLLCSESVG